MLGNIKPEQAQRIAPEYTADDKNRVMQRLVYRGSEPFASTTQMKKARLAATEKFLEVVGGIPYWDDRYKLPKLWKEYGDERFELESETKEMAA